MKKKCSKCQTEKQLELFPKGTGIHGTHSWCKVCLAAYNKEWFKSKKKEKKVNPYAEHTVESDIWLHLYRFGVALEHQQVISLLERLKKADNFLAEMDKIELELGCKVEDYDLSGIDHRFKDSD